MFLLGLQLLYLVFFTVIMWKLYVKAGKPGWAAVVPVYNTVVMAQIAKKNQFVGVVGGLFVVFSVAREFLDVMPILGVGRLVSAIAALYILNSFIKQYNRGIGYWALVVFLPFIAVFFTDKSEYIGGGQGPASTTGVQDQPVVSAVQTDGASSEPVLNPVQMPVTSQPTAEGQQNPTSSENQTKQL